jgi:FkbM family methyltransferase
MRNLRYRAGLVVDLATNRGGRRQARVRELFFHAARRFTPVMAATPGYGLMYISTSDRYVGTELFLRGDTDGDAIGEVLDVLGTHSKRPGTGLVVEIGANIGSTTLPALKRFGFDSVLVIEPLPANLDLLGQNLSINGVADRATLLPIGVSRQDGTMTLQVAPDNSGDNRLVNDSEVAAHGEFAEDERETIEVTVRSWDSLVADGTIPIDDVDLVWIDIQGHEGHLFSGASTLLERRLPVVMEFWPYGLRRAGGLELVQDLVSQHYERIVDMHPFDEGVEPELLPASAISAVAKRVTGTLHTDLVLLPD